MKHTNRLAPILLGIFCMSASAFDTRTHAAMTAAAASKSRLGLSPSLRPLLSSLGLFDYDFALESRYIDIAPQMTTRFASRFEGSVLDEMRKPATGLNIPEAYTITGWLMRGAIREDDNSVELEPRFQDEPGGTFSRVFGHFHDPENDRGLTFSFRLLVVLLLRQKLRNPGATRIRVFSLCSYGQFASSSSFNICSCTRAASWLTPNRETRSSRVSLISTKSNPMSNSAFGENPRVTIFKSGYEYSTWANSCPADGYACPTVKHLAKVAGQTVKLKKRVDGHKKLDRTYSPYFGLDIALYNILNSCNANKIPRMLEALTTEHDVMEKSGFLNTGQLPSKIAIDRKREWCDKPGGVGLGGTK